MVKDVNLFLPLALDWMNPLKTWMAYFLPMNYSA
jgi:hypothetical protein